MGGDKLGSAKRAVRCLIRKKSKNSNFVFSTLDFRSDDFKYWNYFKSFK